MNDSSPARHGFFTDSSTESSNPETVGSKLFLATKRPTGHQIYHGQNCFMISLGHGGIRFFSVSCEEPCEEPCESWSNSAVSVVPLALF